MGKRPTGEPALGKKRRKPREAAATGERGGRRRSVLEPEVDALQGPEEAPVAEEPTVGSAAPSVPAEPPAPAVGEHGVVSGDVGLLPIDDMIALLAEAADVQRQFSLTEQEVAGAVAKYDDLQTKRGLVDRVREHLVGRSARMGTEFSSESQRLDDPNAWTADDLQQFVAEGILTEQYAASFGLFKQRIDSLSADEQFASSQKGREILAKLRLAREEIVRGIKNKLDVKHQKTGARIQRMHDSAEEHHTARVARLEAEMGTIRENPLVAERLEKREEERVAAETAARQAAELERLRKAAEARAAVERQRKEMLGRIEDALRFMEERFAAAWKRITAIVGSDVHASLFAAMGEKKKDKLFAPARTALVNAAKGEGTEKLQSPADVTPWMMKLKGKGSYGDALRFLSGGEVRNTVRGLPELEQQKLQQRIDSVQAEATLFNFLLNGNGPKEASPFFRAFNERSKGAGAAPGSADAGTKVPAADAAAAIKAKEARRAFAMEVKEVLDAGGFAVEVPTPQGSVSGAVHVEKALGKKKPGKKEQTPIYRITRIVGSLPGIKVGHTSAIDPLHNSFPQWFRVEVDKHFKEVAAKEQAEFAARVAAASAAESAAAAVPEAGAPTPAEAAPSAAAPAAEAAPGGVEGDSVAP